MARSLIWNEAMSRATVFLTVLLHHRNHDDERGLVTTHMLYRPTQLRLRPHFLVNTPTIVATVDAALATVIVVLLWGLLSFITNYIPNIGFALGLLPPALVALLQGGVRQAVLVIVAYAVINVIIQSLLPPKFVGGRGGLSVTLTFLSLVFWTFVMGPLGALLAVPLSLFAKALLVDADPDSRWLDPLISPSRQGNGDAPGRDG